MTMHIRLIKYCKNCALLLSTLLIVACQPPAPVDNQQPNKDSKQADSPIIYGVDSVTMASDYILNIKPSRYQPSLGLQGVIKPIKQSRFVAAQDVIVQKTLVSEGQWVEKGMPLLILKRQSSTDETVNTATSNEQQEAETTAGTAKQPANIQQGDKTNSDNEGKASKNLSKVAEQLTTNGNKPADNVALADDDPAGSVATNKNIVTDKNLAISKNIDNSVNSEKIDTSQDIALTEQSAQLKLSAQSVVVRASFSGRVNKLYVKTAQQVGARTPLLRLGDDKDLHFIATLPLKTKSQLSVGQTVNFTAKDLPEQFVGQVSKLVASNQPDKLRVYVNVVKNEASRDKLKPDMVVSGRVNYGQIEVGTIVPEHGIHDVDLSVLKKPPYQSLMPLTANVWIIKQDQRLTRLPVEVIKYDPSTDQYLVARISNDSLICLADLPIESVGKKVIVS